MEQPKSSSVPVPHCRGIVDSTTDRQKAQALLLLEKCTSKFEESDSDTRQDSANWGFYFLISDLSSVKLDVGQNQSALETAEKAVAKCRELHLSHPHKVRPRLAIAHALTSLSNCLAACGLADEGRRAAQEAAVIYATLPWCGFCPEGYRRQEFSSEALHTLSLRLAASGQLDEALVKAEQAVEEYRELVSLAVRHAPSLANGLRNLASRFWDVGRFDESIAALKEAIGFLRGVADQQLYHFPTLGDALEQLAEYLSIQGDVEGSSTATSECALIRERLARSPVSTERKTEAESDSECWDAEDASRKVIISQGGTLAVAVATHSEQELQRGGVAPSHAKEVSRSPLEAQLAGLSSLPEPETSLAAQPGVPAKEPFGTGKAANGDTRFKVKIELKNPPLDLVWWILLGISSLAWAGLVLVLARK
jgi:tetratricopeptide (TPR) repeat protein